MANHANHIHEQLAKASSALFSVQCEQEALNIILRAIQSLGFDRIRFYWLNEGRRFLVGHSHLGDNDTFIGSRLPISVDLHSQTLPFDARPQVFKRNEAKPALFEVTASEEDVKEFALIPMVHGGEFIGAFIADNKPSKRPINKEALGYLIPFISQAGAILVKRRLEEAERRARNLNTVLQVSIKVNSSLDLNLILNATCRSAVELLGVSHSGFMRFDPNLETGKVYAEYPDQGAIGQVIPLREVPAWEEFVKSPKPFIVPDVEKELSLGPGREILLKNNIRSTLIVPVVRGNHLLGSFGMDSIGVIRNFTPQEVEVCEIFADQVAKAIENAQLFEDTKKQAAQLEHLRRTTLAITASTDRDTLLDTIIHQAVALLEARSGGIYEYTEERGELLIVNDSHRSENVGKVLTVGKGMAGRLVQSNKPFMTVKDYNSWSGKSRLFVNGRHHFGAVLEVPLKWDERTIGVLYIDDKSGRKFTPQEARLLTLFADQAAIALVNIDNTAKDEEKLKRLERLSSATGEIVSNVGKATMDEMLTLIAKHATEILDAESCGVFLVRQKGYITLEASYGHSAGGFRKGKLFPIVSGVGSGLTGHIAYEGKLLNAHGDDLVNHFAVRRAGTNHTPTGKCHSLLAIPMKKKTRDEEKLVGLLRLDNKKGSDGRPLPTLSFSVEDEWILSIFAETVVMAIERSLFNEQLSKQQENLERFLNSSANGVIAVDALGNVIRFNKRAEEILGYQSNEVLYTSVERLYFDPQEARRISKLMRESEDNKITNFDTAIRNKAGEKVPIRLSATQLYDQEDNYIGSVGYFDRAIREIQSLLLKASDIVDKAKSSADGLPQIAEILLPLFSRTFCRVLLREDEKQPLVVRAARYMSAAGDRQEWTPGVGESFEVSRWPGLNDLLAEGKPKVLKWSKEQYRSNLKNLSRSLGLKKHIESLLVVPLTIGGKNLGLLEIGELGEERPEFSQEEIDHISEVAAQTTILILTSLYRITAGHKEEIEHLYDAATAMTEALDLREVLETVAGRARDILGADSSAIWSYDNVQDKFIAEEMVAVGIPEEEQQRFRNEELKPGRTAYTVLREGWIGVPDAADPKLKFIGHHTRELLSRIGVRSFEGIALKVGGEPVGVLYVNYAAPRTFDHGDRRALENFAAYAALSLRRARLLDQVRKAKQIAEAVTYLTALGDRDLTLKSILQGATDLLGCAAVVLYIYDQENDEFHYPPTYKGLKHPEKVIQRKGVAPDALVREMLWRDKPYPVNNVVKDKFFSNKQFARREKIVSCIAIPLEASGKKVGVMFINYRQPHRFPEDEIGIVKLVGTQAAVAISNARLYEQARKREAVLESLYHAGRAITSSLSLDKTLDQIAQQSLNIVGVASGKQPAFSHVLVRAGSRLYSGAMSSNRVKTKLEQKISEIDLSRPGVSDGIAGRVVRNDKPENIGDVRNDPDYVEVSRAIRSQLSVPLRIGRRVVGVLSIEHPELNAFSPEDQKNVELLAAQAAVAIDNARRHEYAENLYQAAQKIAKAFNLREVLETVAGRARDILGADSSAIWSYDNVQDKFIAEEMVVVNIPDTEAKRLLAEPKPGRTSLAILNKGWVGIEDPNSPEAAFLGDSTRSFLKRIGVRSFEGIALKVGGEPVGVLYVNYAAPRTFDHGDRRALENFAAYAALSLRRARLLDQVRKARTVAQEVAYVTTLGERNATLESCTWAALEVLNCDSVTLYEYDAVSRKLSYPPTNRGLLNPSRVAHLEGVSDDSIVRKVLRRTAPYVVENADNDPIFQHSRFAREEKISSSVAIPLVVRGQKLGVMFANYRSPHRFTKEEISGIRLFSLQVAVAISNAQLYDQAQKRFEALEGLYAANREITSSLDTKATLREIVLQALQVIGPAGKASACFSHVALKESKSSELEFIWSSSPKVLKLLRGDSTSDGAYKAKTSNGIAGRVARNGMPENIGDARNDPDYVEVSRAIRSQLSVPLLIRKRVVGVLSIEHPELNAFSPEDQKNVELLAAQAAVAIEHARQFEALNRAKGQVGSLTALAWMGMANNMWRHAIEQYAITTQLTLRNLRDEMQKISLKPGERKRVEKRLGKIASQMQQMLNEPITPPLSDKEGIEMIFVNDYVAERMAQFERDGQLAGVRWKPDLMPEHIAIICNRDWLGRAIDILVNNAVKAMTDTNARRLTVSTRKTNGAVEIAFADTGKGIPPRIARKLFREVIPRPFSKGMGIGLLILQAIVQAYEGYVTIESTGDKGTTIVIGFPQAEDT